MKEKILITVMSAILLSACDNEQNNYATTEKSISSTTTPVASSSSAGEIGDLAFDITTFVLKHPVLRCLELLKILNGLNEISYKNQAKYDAKEKTVLFNSALPNGSQAKVKVYSDKDYASFETDNNKIDFSPLTLQTKFGLKTPEDVNRLDHQIEKHYTECTDAILNDEKIDHQNYLQEIHLRVQCLESKGYDENDRAYMQIKHGIDA
jgi:hypothetical protein